MLLNNNITHERAGHQYATLNSGSKHRHSRETGSQYGTLRHHRSHSPSPCGAAHSTSLVHFHHPDLLPATTGLIQPSHHKSRSRSRGASQATHQPLPSDLSFYTLYHFEPIEVDTPSASKQKPPSAQAFPSSDSDDVTFATGGQHRSRRDWAPSMQPVRPLSPRERTTPALQLAILGLDPADRAVLRIAGSLDFSFRLR